MEDSCLDAKKLYESGYNLYQKGIIENIDKYLKLLEEIAEDIAENWFGKVVHGLVDAIRFSIFGLPF